MGRCSFVSAPSYDRINSQRRTNLGPATSESGSRRARSWPQTRSSLLPRALIITMTDFPLQLFISTSNLTSFKAVLLLCLSLGAERSLQCLSDSFYAVVEMDAMRFDGGTVHRQVPFLVAESVGIRQYPFRWFSELHQGGGSEKELVAVDIVAAAKIIDASWQGKGFVDISDHLPYVGHAAKFMNGRLERFSLTGCLLQVRKEVTILLQTGIWQIVHPCQP